MLSLQQHGIFSSFPRFIHKPFIPKCILLFTANLGCLNIPPTSPLSYNFIELKNFDVFRVNLIKLL